MPLVLFLLVKKSRFWYHKNGTVILQNVRIIRR